MKIICHFGAHKTASSHLQYNLEINRKLLNKNNVAYFRFHDIPQLRWEAMKLRCQLNEKRFDVVKSAELIHEIIKKEIEGYDCAIISYEGILGDMNHFNLNDIYPEAEQIAQIYNTYVFKNHKIIPVFSTRDYDGFIRSSYKWCLENKKKKFAYTLEEYLKNIRFNSHRWTEIIEILDGKFDNSPRVYDLSDYKRKWKEIIYGMLKLTGKEIDYTKIQLDAKKKNKSGNKKSLDYYYTRNYFIQKMPNFKGKGRVNKIIRKNPDIFRTKVGSLFLKSHKKEEIPRLNDFEMYKDELESLKRNYGLLR